jgi:hypothetical protein
MLRSLGALKRTILIRFLRKEVGRERGLKEKGVIIKRGFISQNSGHLIITTGYELGTLYNE